MKERIAAALSDWANITEEETERKTILNSWQEMPPLKNSNKQNLYIANI